MSSAHQADAASNFEVMRRLFNPESVAVVGASATPGRIGYSIVDNLLSGGYQGKVYPINPAAGEVKGLKMYPSLKEAPGEVDVVIVAIPARAVPAIVPQAAARGAAGMVVISSGFAETGDTALQEELVAAARRHNIRIVGPNTYGYYYTPTNLCATFCTPYNRKGGVALVSQSGGVGMAILGYSRSHQMGVSAIVGLGNKCDVDEDDLLDFFRQDPNTQVVAIHMEGLRDGRGFLRAAREITKTKPVVVLKAGRTSRGARAASSHTAALAGQDSVYDAAFRQSGVVRALTLEDLLDWARVLQMLPDPQGENVVIITGAGGLGVLLSDACEDFGLHLMSLPPALNETFKQFIPPFGASGNPIDITGGEPPETYYRCILTALKEPQIHSLLIGYWQTLITPPMIFAETLYRAVKEAEEAGVRKPLVVNLAGDVEVQDAAQFLEERGIPSYPYATEKAAAALAAKDRSWRYSRGS